MGWYSLASILASNEVLITKGGNDFTDEEDDKQNCDHPISKHDIEGNSDANS